MGHPTDIFLSKPDSNFICAICHDVLKGASCFKECGHTFCEECVSLATNRPHPTCPTCRKHVHTGSNPNYALRDIIDKLEVRCPEELEERPAKRLKSTGDNCDDNGDEYSPCDWRGTVSGLKKHVADECLLATMSCGEEGCQHMCQRRHMEAHRSSQKGMMRHMELKYENKLKALEMKYESKYQMMNDRIIDLEKKANLCFNKHCSLPNREIKRGVMYCTRCGVANYCSRACQTSDWRNHQAYCDRHAGRVARERRVERQPTANGDGGNITDPLNIVTRRGGDGRSVALFSGSVAYRNFLNAAIVRTIEVKLNTGDSISGPHVNEIILSLQGDGFSEDEVRLALVNLASVGTVCTTIDENHYTLGDESESTERTTRFAYGNSLNDAIVRNLRNLGAQAEDGVYIIDIVFELQNPIIGIMPDEREVRAALNHLVSEGHVYTTIDNDHFQWSEYPPH